MKTNFFIRTKPNQIKRNKKTYFSLQITNVNICLKIKSNWESRNELRKFANGVSIQANANKRNEQWFNIGDGFKMASTNGNAIIQLFLPVFLSTVEKTNLDA